MKNYGESGKKKLKMSEIFNPKVAKIWAEYNTNRDIITKILELSKNNHLSIKHKRTLFNMIKNSNRTEKQKSRFIKFYNLDINNQYDYTLTSLSRECGCRVSAIKFSLMSVITYTLLNNDENMKILQNIIDE